MIHGVLLILAGSMFAFQNGGLFGKAVFDLTNGE
jgi:hypothetical protein